MDNDFEKAEELIDDLEIALIVNERKNMPWEPLEEVAKRLGLVLKDLRF